jgi:hypothetical protein
MDPAARSRLLRQLGLLAVLTLLYLGGVWLRGPSAEGPSPAAPATDTELLARLASAPLVLTRHGRCRMDCRGINLEEVRAVLRDGTVNHAKSEPGDEPCPAWAVEGRTEDGQRVRVVFAGCAGETRVITAIDLDGEYACACD